MTSVALGGIVAIVQTIMGSHQFLFVAYAVLNILDALSALIVAASTHTYDSSKLVKGLVRKVGYWILILVSFGMGMIFERLGEVLSIDLSVSYIVGWFVLALLIFHEFRSILQSVGQMGVPIPKILTDILSIAETEVEKMEESYDGRMVVNLSDPEKDVYRLEYDGNIADIADKTELRLKVEHEDE